MQPVRAFDKLKNLFSGGKQDQQMKQEEEEEEEQEGQEEDDGSTMVRIDGETPSLSMSSSQNSGGSYTITE